MVALPDDLASCDLWNYTLIHLPTISEAVLAIVAYSPCYGSEKQKKVLNKFSKLLRLKWYQAFGDYIVSINTVKNKLDSHLQTYATKVTKGRGTKRTKITKWVKNINKVLLLCYIC